MKDEISGVANYHRLPENHLVTFAETGYVYVNRPSNLPVAPRTRKATRKGPYRAYFKRAMDIALTLIAMPFWVPMIALCAIALRLEGGKAFYSQKRLGENGKSFSILKLRSMVDNADAVLEDYLAQDPVMRKEWNEKQKIANDPRITPLGKFLRKTSLDELPQLINVLRGDMSLVGPRPMMPDQLGMYGAPHAYFALKPGITGLWQVSARNTARFSYRNEVDDTYERSLNFKTDIAILLKTVGVVLRPTGS